MRRDSSAGIENGYGLNGPGIEFRWRRDFPPSSRPTLGLTDLPIYWVPVPLPDRTWPERGVDHERTCSALVEERGELYLCSLCGPSLQVTLPLQLKSADSKAGYPEIQLSGSAWHFA